MCVEGGGGGAGFFFKIEKVSWGFFPKEKKKKKIGWGCSGVNSFFLLEFSSFSLMISTPFSGYCTYISK